MQPNSVWSDRQGLIANIDSLQKVPGIEQLPGQNRCGLGLCLSFDRSNFQISCHIYFHEPEVVIFECDPKSYMCMLRKKNGTTMSIVWRGFNSPATAFGVTEEITSALATFSWIASIPPAKE